MNAASVKLDNEGTLDALFSEINLLQMLLSTTSLRFGSKICPPTPLPPTPILLANVCKWVCCFTCCTASWCKTLQPPCKKSRSRCCIKGLVWCRSRFNNVSWQHHPVVELPWGVKTPSLPFVCSVLTQFWKSGPLWCCMWEWHFADAFSSWVTTLSRVFPLPCLWRC